MLIHLYAVHAWGQNSKTDAETPRTNGMPNGHARANGHARTGSRIRDAEEFELAGLISGDEDEDEDATPIENKERHPLNARH